MKSKKGSEAPDLNKMSEAHLMKIQGGEDGSSIHPRGDVVPPTKAVGLSPPKKEKYKKKEDPDVCTIHAGARDIVSCTCAWARA